MDFAFNGRLPLGEACEKAGTDPTRLLSAAEAAAPAAGGPRPWAERGIPALIRHLVDEHHTSNRSAIPRAIERTRRLIAKDNEHTPHLQRRVLRALSALHEDLDLHLLKEERVLFPWILRGTDDLDLEPLRAMHGDHEDLQRLLQRLRVAAQTPPHGRRPPELTALYQDLTRIDFDLQVHVHLENNVLFPLVAATHLGTPPA